VAEKAKTPVIGTSCTNPLVTSGKKYYFRACFIDPYQGAGAATYAVKNLGFKKAAILKDVANDYAVGLAKFFVGSFQKQGGEIVSNLNYQSGDQDFTPQLTEIISQKPEVLFIPAYFAEGAIIMKQARELGATFRIMGGDAMDNPDVVNIGGSAVEGFIITAFPYAASMPNMNPQAKQFTDDWAKQYPGKEPNMNSALGYTCYMMFMAAIEKAGSDDREAVTKAIAETKDLPTVFGPLTLNADGDAEMAIGIIEIKDGQRLYIGEVTPEM
jgi:branched-chain amino acid transport system substrate-binding protein